MVTTSSSSYVQLDQSSNHKIIVNLTSGSAYYKLPTSPVNGETFEFIKPKSGCTVTIYSASSNIYNCHAFTTGATVKLLSGNKCKVTVTYSSTMSQWILMRDDFLRLPVSPLAVGTMTYTTVYSSKVSVSAVTYDSSTLYAARYAEGGFYLYLPYT